MNNTSIAPLSETLTPVAQSGHNNHRDTQAIREALVKYRPTTMPKRRWMTIASFCIEAVSEFEAANSKLAVELLSNLAQYVNWAVHEQHAPLDREELLHHGLITRYLKQVTRVGGSSYSTQRSRLMRIANELTSVAGTRGRQSQRYDEVHEYTRAEMAALESWAASRRSQTRRLHASTVIGLAGGAGLWPREINSILGKHIVSTPKGITVEIAGTNPRIVPVRREWAPFLEKPFHTYRPDDHVVFPNATDGHRANAVTTLTRDPHPAPRIQWLRDTWVLGLLRDLPLQVVMDVSGITDTATFRRYLPYLRLENIRRWDDFTRDPLSLHTLLTARTEALSKNTVEDSAEVTR